MRTASRHVVSLIAAEAAHTSALGSVARLTADTFPILRGMSVQRTVLQPGTIREPHWQVNANELTYCISGSLVVSVLDNVDVFSTFTIDAGQMFHVDSGSLFYIENVGGDVSELVSVLSNERPEEVSLHASFGAMTDAVLGNTYDLPASSFAPLGRDTTSKTLVRSVRSPDIPISAGYLNPHKFDAESQKSPLDYPFASAKLARAQFWPALKNLSMYAITVEEDGMREPHWHPETAELGYVHRGHVRMTILDPDGTTDTYELEPGDSYFIPRSYPHQIEVIGDEEIHFLIFFDQPTPGDIGYRAAGSLLPRSVLAATFDITEDQLPQLPFTPIDPLFVHKLNYTDAVAQPE
jgi:oxalate decarboxylase